MSVTRENIKPLTFVFEDDGLVPNNLMPFLVYEQAVDVALLVVGRPQVVEVQAERGDEPPELHVPRVDELAAVLGTLSL